MTNLDAALARELLNELVTRARAHGTELTVHVFGGAAVALRYRLGTESRITRDIDALLKPSREDAVISAAIAEIAKERGLPRDWINDAGKGWLPPTDSTEKIEPNDQFTVSRGAELLAMKFDRASEADLDDILIIAAGEGITSAEEAITIAESVIPEGSVLWSAYPRDEFLLLATQLFERRKSG